jgi:hypothetical protein
MEETSRGGRLRLGRSGSAGRARLHRQGRSAPHPGKIRRGDPRRGRFTETLSDGKIFEIGRITAWEPGVRLAFTWRQATFSPEQVTEVEVRFEPIGDETRVTVEHRGRDKVPQEHVARHAFPDAIFLRRHGEWWQALLSSYRQRFAAELTQSGGSHDIR